SESLDQTQTLPGAAFSIAPNGGSGIAGTAAAVSYPGTNQTRFTLASSVHHLDSLALTYTKPGSDPIVRDAAPTTGNAAVTATLGNASVTNNTANAAPSIQTLVTPNAGKNVGSNRPLLPNTMADTIGNTSGCI